MKNHRTIYVQLANGILHNKKWEKRNIFKIRARNLNDAAYKAVRDLHPFLTDDNHCYEVGEKSFQWGGETIKFKSVVIYPNDKSPKFIQHPCVDYWFAVQYRGVWK